MYVEISGGGWSNHATFRLTGDRLDPEVVTRMLGTPPSDAGKRGEPRPRDPTRVHRTGAWSLESSAVLSEMDDHLDDHLRWLLDQIEPHARQLEDVVAEQDLVAEFWCVVLMESANVDFELQPETIGRVAALDATLRLDVYAPASVERDVIEVPDPPEH